MGTLEGSACRCPNWALWFGEGITRANMATITNKTFKALSVPLPGGKKLRLGPLKSGEISPKAIDHPPVQKLSEAGEVEISGSDQKPRGAGDGGRSVRRSTGGQGHGGGFRQTGDRYPRGA